jgi:hypothetical protein
MTNNTITNKNDENVLDIYFGNAVMNVVLKFVKYTSIPSYQSATETTFWSKIDKSERQMLSLTIARTSLFVRGFPIYFDNIDLSNYKTDKSIIFRRQSMLREQGLIQNILVLLNLFRPVTKWFILDASTNKIQHSNLFQLGKATISELLTLLFDLVKQNVENQIYISDHLLIILSYVSIDRTAANIAEELLSSNRELQEKKIGVNEITIFAEKMRETPMNSMFLQLLQTCCSCLVCVFLFA